MEIQGYSQEEMQAMWESGVAIDTRPTRKCVGKRIVYPIGREFTLVKPSTAEGVNYIKNQHPTARLVRRS